jgi:serine/threonine protein kinase
MDHIQVSIDVYHKLYEQGELIGQGATSMVYAVKEKRTGKKFAVKVIPRKKILSSMFPVISKEIGILKRLNHSNIIKMHDTIITEDNLYIITDLVSGPELFDVIVDRNSFPEHEARALIQKILGAVSYLHSQHITHGDIKPENLKYESEDSNEVKLLDFGFARLVDKPEDNTGNQAGTLAYEAPEVLAGGSTSFAADMWAFGVMAYIMLCGYPPFFSNSEYERDHDSLGRYPFWVFFNDDTPYLRNSVMKGRFAFPDESWANITDEAKDFISRLLKVDPSERLTAEQALSHPWFQLPADAMSSLPDQASHGHMAFNDPREILAKFLRNRPAREQLERAHILIGDAKHHVSSWLAAKQHELLMAERRDQLRHHLKNRPALTLPTIQHILCI